MNPLRHLDFDDLLLLSYLKSGASISECARRLSISQPACSQRIRKIESSFHTKILKKVGKGRAMTSEGLQIGERATEAIELLQANHGVKSQSVVTVGTRPEVGMSWLWPCVKKISKSEENLTFHLHFGSGDENLRLLTAGSLDIVLTSAPLTTKDYQAIELEEEKYVFVAAPRIARAIKTLDHLSQYILIEHDRSFPFQRYLTSEMRRKVRYKDVWFLGSTNSMAEAVSSGLGVAILPEYLARNKLLQGTLAKVPLRMAIESDFFRLIFKKENEPARICAEKLASSLQIRGLS